MLMLGCLNREYNCTSYNWVSSDQLQDIGCPTSGYFFLSFSPHSCQSPLCAIRRVLEKTSDLGLIYIHHPLLLKFFLRYSELMGRFGHKILQLWFSWEDYSQIETEDAASGLSSGLPDYPSSFNTLLHILKGNSSVLLILLVCDFHKDNLPCVAPIQEST